MIFGQRLAESKRGKFCVSPGRCMKDKVSTRVRGRRSQPQREWWKITQSGWEEVGTNHVVVQSLSHVWLTATPWTAPHQAAQFFIISGVCSNSRPLSQWCHPTISSSVIPFSSCLQSFPASGSFPMSQFFPPVAKVLELQLQHQSLQWIFRVDFL